MTAKIRKYAEGTTVPTSKTRLEIEELVRKAGATKFGTAIEPNKATVMFEMNGRTIRVSIGGAEGDEAEIRRQWRSLHLHLKAKFTAIADGLVSFEDEFMAQTVVSGGETVADKIRGQLENALSRGGAFMPMLGTGR